MSTDLLPKESIESCFREYLRARGLSFTPQRNTILEYLCGETSQGHYEFVGNTRHHEHMTCTKCGNVFEFTDTLLEKCIEDVA